jgi:coproporphyrinogen III oxidase
MTEETQSSNTHHALLYWKDDKTSVLCHVYQTSEGSKFEFGSFGTPRNVVSKTLVKQTSMPWYKFVDMCEKHGREGGNCKKWCDDLISLIPEKEENGIIGSVYLLTIRSENDRLMGKINKDSASSI